MESEKQFIWVKNLQPHRGRVEELKVWKNRYRIRYHRHENIFHDATNDIIVRVFPSRQVVWLISIVERESDDNKTIHNFVQLPSMYVEKKKIFYFFHIDPSIRTVPPSGSMNSRF